MNKTILIFLSFILTNGLCYAAEQGPAVKMTKPSGAMTYQMAQGIIDSISPADPSKNIQSSMVLKGDNGNSVKFLLSKAAIYDINSKQMTLAQLKAGEKVKVKYFTTKDGMNKAHSVALVN